MDIVKALSDCKVLLVDDTKTNIDILVQTLKEEYKLGVALDGRKAVDYCHAQSVDLILLDILMPEMDGFQVCSALKGHEDTRDIPIIFITAMDDTKHKSKGFLLGAVDYITKPFDITEVKARVKNHLKLKLLAETLQNQNRILEEKVRERTRELEETQVEIVERLGLATEYRDMETGQHLKRMSEYCRLLGKAAGLDEEAYNLIALASSMHDTGKIGISDTILLKPGPLNDEERATMRTHISLGAKLLSGSKSRLLQMAEVIAKTHHEKWDGTGYDQGLKQKEIPLPGRIVCICDVFDALVSDRPYKKAWPIEMALEEIQSCSGSYFDPNLVQLFLGLEPQIREVIDRWG